jgi:hypothetical protein
MRRILIITLGVALLAATALVVHGTAAGSTPTAATTPPAAAPTGTPANEHALERGLPITNPPPAHPAGGDLAAQLARARLASGRYATDLGAAKADGYQLITRMLPDMGWHFLNPAIQGFEVTKPHILVYERHGRRWQLGALEWVFPHQPEVPPLPGATYGSFAAACHYRDGSFSFARVQQLCAKRSPATGARFNFWHPDLVTLHLWLWYPNPDGLYNGTNPLVRPFNRG